MGQGLGGCLHGHSSWEMERKWMAWGTWKGSSVAGAIQVSCLCESCVLVQFRHNHTVSGQHRYLSCLLSHCVAANPRCLGRRTCTQTTWKYFMEHDLIYQGYLYQGFCETEFFYGLWILLFYTLAAWTWVNFRHLLICTFTKYNFLWFTLNLEPASFLSWPVSLGKSCCPWWKSSQCVSCPAKACWQEMSLCQSIS